MGILIGTAFLAFGNTEKSKIILMHFVMMSYCLFEHSYNKCIMRHSTFKYQSSRFNAINPPQPSPPPYTMGLAWYV